MDRKWDRTLALGAGLILFAWFLFVIRGGLSSWFDGDDLMNLSYYWSRPWWALIKANLAFWSSYYRPGGGLFYRILYALFGFHPLPFRVAALALLCADFALLAIVVRQITGSCWAALLALLVVGINPTFSAAYFDGGTIYDVLAYVFFWGAFAWYVRVRQAGRLPGWRDSLLLLALFVIALDCKEVSVSLPAAVGLYELVWHTPASWRPAELWRWIWREGRLTCVAGLLDVVYVIGKKYGPDSLWQQGPYQPHFSWPTYLASQTHYFRELIYKPVNISDNQMLALLVAIVIVAVVTRRRFLLWAAGFILTGILPLAFIPGRGGFAYMVPSIGWAVYICGLVGWLLDLATGRWIRVHAAAQVVALTVLFILLAPWQRTFIRMHARAAHDGQERFHRYDDQMASLFPAPPRQGARMLLLSDAEGHDDYDVYFLIRLHFGTRWLEPERMTVWTQHNVHVDPSSYDYVLDWVGDRFAIVSHK